MKVENAYERIAYLLTNLPPKSDASRQDWIAEFNDLAMELENEDARSREDLAVITSEGDEQPFSTSTLAWKACEHSKIVYVITPPMIKGTKGVRLAIPVAGKRWYAGNHIYVLALPPDRDATPEDFQNARSPCLTSSAPEDLSANFALWDYIARVGVKEAASRNVITDGWLSQVFDIAAPCNPNIRNATRARGGHIYPADRNDLVPCYHSEDAGGKVNAQIRELNILLQRLGITREQLEGEISRDKGGRLYSSWFNGIGTCTCCKKSVRSPTRHWPFSQYKHIKSIGHLKKAAEAILKLRGQANTNG